MLIITHYILDFNIISDHKKNKSLNKLNNTNVSGFNIITFWFVLIKFEIVFLRNIYQY